MLDPGEAIPFVRSDRRECGRIEGSDVPADRGEKRRHVRDRRTVGVAIGLGQRLPALEHGERSDAEHTGFAEIMGVE